MKGFSLGMAQRLGIAAALLGDPGVLLFDEPVNGLDTEGIRWIRDLMKGLAAEGRTIFLASHLMSEMELTADHLVVIGRGRLIADTSMRDFIERNSQPVTVVRSPQPDELRAALLRVGAAVDADPGGGWQVSGPDAAAIGDLAASHRIRLHELTPRFSSLEDVYTRMTQDSTDYRGTPATAPPTREGRINDEPGDE
jgi:ABC-2 type transport system ATP-binding protein